jgi:hypothetical protein
MEIQYQRTFSDYEEALTAQRVKSRPLKIAFTIAFLLILFLGVFLLVSLGLTLAAGTVAMFVGSFILAKILSVTSALWRKRWIKRDFHLHPNFARPVRVGIDEAGLHSESEVWSERTKWDSYVKHGETKNLFLLYLGARSVEVLPKRAFSTEQAEEFRRLVRAKFPDGSFNSERRSQRVENPS